MSEARKDPAEAPEAAAGPRDALIHDDDELAAALQAQLERFAPSGSIPVISPERAAQYEAGRFAPPPVPGGPRGGSVPAGSAPVAPTQASSAPAAPSHPPALSPSVDGSGETPPSPVPAPGAAPDPSFGDAGERLPSVHRPPTAATPTIVPTDTGSMRRPKWPTFAQADTPAGGQTVASPSAESANDAPILPPGRHTGGAARVPVRTGPIRVDGIADHGTPSAPAVPTAASASAFVPSPAPTTPDRQSSFAPPAESPGSPQRSPEPSPGGLVSGDDPRFSFPVPHFDPPSLSVPPAPPAELSPAPSAPPPREAPLSPAHEEPDPLDLLERMQPRLANLQLDPETYAEWERSLLQIADTPPPDLPPLLPPSAAASPPEVESPAGGDRPPVASLRPAFGDPAPYIPWTGASPMPAAPESALPIGDVAAMPVAPDFEHDDDVIHAELVDDDIDVDEAEDTGERAPMEEPSAGVPAVQAHAGPVSATGAPAPAYRGGAGEPAAAGETGEVEALDLDGITTDTGALNTGSLPIIVSALDRDLDDDVDDVVAPQELLLEVGTTGEVGIVGAGPDTGQVAPVASTSVRTGVITVPTPEQAAPSPYGVEAADLAPTDEDLRLRRPVSQFWLWLAPNSSALTLALGATLIALGISFRQALVAAVVGVVAACLTLAVGVLAAKRTGQPVAVVSRAAFGLRGNLLPTLVLLLVRLFWAAVLSWLAAGTVRSVMTAAGWDSVLPAQTGGILAGVVLPVVATLIAVFGHGLLARVHLVLGALSAVLLILLIVLTAPLLDFTTVLATPDGPPLRLVGAAVAVLSLLAVAWASAGGELARYQNPVSSGTGTAGWAALGAALPALVLTAWGVLLASSVRPGQADALSRDPVGALLDRLPSWYPIPLLLAIVLGLVAALATVLYSTGLTLGAVGLRLHRVYRTLAGAAVAIAAGIALLLLDAPMTALLSGLVPVLAVPVVAWTGILAAEFFLRTRPFDSSALLVRGGRYPDVRWVPVVALALISALGIGLVGGGGFAGIAGYLWRLLGVGQDSALAQADLGVPLALVLGLLTPLLLGRAELQRQEDRTPVVATLEE